MVIDTTNAVPSASWRSSLGTIHKSDIPKASEIIYSNNNGGLYNIFYRNKKPFGLLKPKVKTRSKRFWKYKKTESFKV
jgi:hypothetical protein